MKTPCWRVNLCIICLVISVAFIKLSMKRRQTSFITSIRSEESEPKHLKISSPNIEPVKRKVDIDLGYYLDTSASTNYVLSLRNDEVCKQRLQTFWASHTEDSARTLLHSCNATRRQMDMVGCKYSLRIVVLTYNRPTSLLRLLNSLNKANYENDRIKLEIWIDKSKTNDWHFETVAVAAGFVFNKGSTDVILRGKHMGLLGQWLSSYKPNVNCSEIPVILEDDIAVSTHFYTYLKMVHNKYGHIEEINGFSTHGRQILFTYPQKSGKVTVPNGNIVYLFPVLGTWGFSPRPKNWSDFIKWLNIARSDPNLQPYVPNHLVTVWFEMHEKSGQLENIWEMWHVYYSWMRKDYTLYNYLPNEEGLTQHWAEKGLHYNNKYASASNPLLQTWNIDVRQLPDHPIHIEIDGHVIG